MTDQLTEEDTKAVLAAKWRELTPGQQQFVHNRQAEAAEQDLTFNTSERVQLIEIAGQSTSHQQTQDALHRLYSQAHRDRFAAIAGSFTQDEQQTFRERQAQLDNVGLGGNSYALHRTAASVKLNDPAETNILIEDLSRRRASNRAHTTEAQSDPVSNERTARASAFVEEQRRTGDAERGQQQWERFEQRAGGRSEAEHRGAQFGGKYDRLNERPMTAAEQRAAARAEISAHRRARAETQQGASPSATNEESRGQREEREAGERGGKGERTEVQMRREALRQARASGGRTDTPEQGREQNESGPSRSGGRSR